MWLLAMVTERISKFNIINTLNSRVKSEHHGKASTSTSMVCFFGYPEELVGNNMRQDAGPDGLSPGLIYQDSPYVLNQLLVLFSKPDFQSMDMDKDIKQDELER